MADIQLFLTRIELDTRKRSVRTAIADPRDLHRCLIRSFPDGMGGPARATANLLYRMETSGPQILAQSTLPPNPDGLPDGFASQTIEATRLLDRLAAGVLVRYKCVATPVKRERETRREVALRGSEAETWWATRARSAGLELTVDEFGQSVGTVEERSVVVRGWRALGYTAFTGLAEVVNADSLRTAVIRGVGRNKNWGAGLLTLAPAR